MGATPSKQKGSKASNPDPTSKDNDGTVGDSSQVTAGSTQASSTGVTDGDSQPSMDRDQSTSASERPSTSHLNEQERLETPGVKQVEVVSVNNGENYEDDTNQTGLSHYEMKIIDSFYSAPERPRSRAYNEAKQAAQQRRTSRKTAKEARRKSKKNTIQTEIEPNTIAYAMENTKKLGILNLSKMSLTEIPDEVFESMPGTARFINVSNNQLTELDVRLCDYVLVQRLTANANLLTCVPTTISRMTALKKLDLAHNKLTHLPDAFSRMRLLEHVDLSQNELTSLPASFMSLKLTALNLSHNRFTSAPVELSSMEWLMDLDFSYNSLRSIPVEYMAWTQMISLNLDHNEITDFPNAMLLACTAMVTLRLRSNPITMAVLEAKTAYPQFDARRNLKLKRQIDAGSIVESDLRPADS